MAASTSIVIGGDQKLFPYLGQILAHPEIDQTTKNRAVAVGFRELEDQWNEDVRGLKEEKHSLEAQLKRAHDQKTDLEVRVTQLGADIGALRGQITDLGRTIEQKNLELQGINQKLVDLDASLAAKQAEATKLNERMQKAQADAEAANQQREKEVKAANDKIDEVQRKAKADAEAANQQREKELKAANDRIDEIQKKAKADAEAANQQREIAVKKANDKIEEIRKKAEADATAANKQKEIELKKANDKIDGIEKKAKEAAAAQELRLKAVEDQNAIAAAAEKQRIEKNRQDLIAAIREKLVDSKDRAWQAINSPAKRIGSLFTAGGASGKARAYVYSRLLIRCFDKYVQDNPGCQPDAALENASKKAKSIDLRVEMIGDVFINGQRCSVFEHGQDFPDIT